MANFLDTSPRTHFPKLQTFYWSNKPKDGALENHKFLVFQEQHFYRNN